MKEVKSMFQFDAKEFRTMIREELEQTLKEQQPSQIRQLPPVLTRDELMEVLHISNTKASELLRRADFPVCREAGVLIPTHLLMQWLEVNTQWIPKNTKGFKVI